MESRQQTDRNERQWRRVLLRFAWWCVLFVALVEVLFIATRDIHGAPHEPLPYLIQFALVPGLLRVLVLAVVQIVSEGLLRDGQFERQSLVYVVGLSLVCANVGWVHRDAVVCQAVFAIPILIAALYPSKRTQWISFWTNLVLYAGFLYLLKEWSPEHAPVFLEVLTVVSLLCFAQMFSLLLLERQMEMTRRIAEAYRLSSLDSLTKLYNHAAFYEELDRHIVKDAKQNRQFCLIIFDIDDFKRVNDRFGHDVGDEVILSLVAAINAAISGEDMAFRYGGEEFTVLTTRSAEQTVALSETIRASFTARTAMLPYGISSTVSAGVSFYSKKYSGRREFFASADEALYEAKRTGKDKTVFYIEKHQQRA